MTQTLDQIPVNALKGVGATLAEKLAKIGLFSLQDLLLHLPLRYLDRTRITPIGALQPNLNAVIEAEVRACDIVLGKRRSLVCRVQDGTGTLTLRFYHFNNAQKQRLVAGARLRVFGETRRGAAGLEMYHPEYDFLAGASPLPLEQTLTPIYPATEGLTQPRLRSLAQQALTWLDKHPLRELLPETVRRRLNQCTLADALRYLHQPPVGANVQQLLEGEHPYQQRLAFEELLAHHLSLLLLRRETQADGAPRLRLTPALEHGFLKQLGFQLTRAQQRVVAEIAEDLAKPLPMLRLVQGDVGSGKTVVAALAALAAVASGKQAAVMAPTEILAEQHRLNFGKWLEPLGIQVGWLTGRLKSGERRYQLEMIAAGTAQVVVGTHALFQDAVAFADLGLVIIDEQHRFGVHQRLSLSEKGQVDGALAGVVRPHQLIMTATPIPRTLAMSAYADLDCSVIDELPPGRTPVTTVVISDNRREEVIERVRLACEQGRQAYWVCTLIEESEALEAQAAQATADSLAQSLPQLRIGLVHGRLKLAEKESVMAGFKAGELDLLVATTVIEVGVDVANASLMIIENPERLGLAQLHQLRGRVGRGSAASHCVLLYGSPLSNNSRERLRVMRESSDGFYIAEQDLLLRGPGEVLGTRQTGDMQFKIADLQRDSHLLPDVKNAALLLMSEHPQVSQLIVQRWLGQNQRYLQV
ncbi:ATP-dependent DNA helicase RecG [Cellvibrio japonicus]|nr:ATP-dependent DNA helicase RecG [Cellvibrio japonicus]QEI13717.1 ATP-dependent DNA helicase RecG [Cellvibrio japonicus]QEI17291.1 ATP-dependent DNA helicase RecG [Cellvibrio japonicus]QEI20868.1 ATP-dependent DNA helicase RecG [Cellvibrio japonicus]